MADDSETQYSTYTARSGGSPKATRDHALLSSPRTPAGLGPNSSDKPAPEMPIADERRLGAARYVYGPVYLFPVALGRNQIVFTDPNLGHKQRSSDARRCTRGLLGRLRITTHAANARHSHRHSSPHRPLLRLAQDTPCISWQRVWWRVFAGQIALGRDVGELCVRQHEVQDGAFCRHADSEWQLTRRDRMLASREHILPQSAYLTDTNLHRLDSIAIARLSHNFAYLEGKNSPVTRAFEALQTILSFNVIAERLLGSTRREKEGGVAKEFSGMAAAEPQEEIVAQFSFDLESDRRFYSLVDECVAPCYEMASVKLIKIIRPLFSVSLTWAPLELARRPDAGRTPPRTSLEIPDQRPDVGPTRLNIRASVPGLTRWRVKPRTSHPSQSALLVLIRNYIFELPDQTVKIQMHITIVPRPKVTGESGAGVPMRVRKVDIVVTKPSPSDSFVDQQSCVPDSPDNDLTPTSTLIASEALNLYYAKLGMVPEARRWHFKRPDMSLTRVGECACSEVWSPTWSILSALCGRNPRLRSAGGPQVEHNSATTTIVDLPPALKTHDDRALDLSFPSGYRDPRCTLPVMSRAIAVPHALLDPEEADQLNVALVVALAVVAVAFGSAIVPRGFEDIESEFGVNKVVTALSVSLMVVGSRIGPLAWSPLSELYGRRPLWIIPALNMAILGGLKLELREKHTFDDESNELNDINKVVVPQQPFVSHEDSIFGFNGAHADEFELPEDVELLLQEKDLENDLTADAIVLWWTPEAYDRRSGCMRLASSTAHRTNRRKCACRTGSSSSVPKELRTRLEKAMTKKNLFRQLKSTKFFQTPKLDWRRVCRCVASRSAGFSTDFFPAQNLSYLHLNYGMSPMLPFVLGLNAFYAFKLYLPGHPEQEPPAGEPKVRFSPAV
uniref:Pre-mRNA splicing factor n=1 Tax=Mycena chlorophos TaxID=658473 RepID=A0ABQ0LVX1_MYCCL|nr:pre-mRNA splicing factor [Mycena chlorophos]